MVARQVLETKKTLEARPSSTESPFQNRPGRRLSFNNVLLLLMMAVGAGVGLLITNALRVPAVMMELDAWFGKPSRPVDTAEGREAQVVFVLFCYVGPLLLGLLLRSLQVGIDWIDRRSRLRTDQEDEAFRMSD